MIAEIQVHFFFKSWYKFTVNKWVNKWEIKNIVIFRLIDYPHHRVATPSKLDLRTSLISGLTCVDSSRYNNITHTICLPTYGRPGLAFSFLLLAFLAVRLIFKPDLSAAARMSLLASVSSQGLGPKKTCGGSKSNPGTDIGASHQKTFFFWLVDIASKVYT